MSFRRVRPLAQIQQGVLDDAVPLSSLLQKIIVLGKQTGLENLRAWAREELNGYAGDSLPNYRLVPAPMIVMITNRAGYHSMTQRLHTSMLPEPFNKRYDIEHAALGNGVGELEALARKGDQVHQLSPGWSSLLIEMLNKFSVSDDQTVVRSAYWTVSNAAIEGLLIGARTALAERLSELTPEDQEASRKTGLEHPVQFAVTGDHNVITYSLQLAGLGGTNIKIDDIISVIKRYEEQHVSNDQSVHVKAGGDAQVAAHSDNVTQIHAGGDVDVTKLTETAQLAAEALPALNLPEDAKAGVEESIKGILEEAKKAEPDQEKLKGWGSRLKAGITVGAGAGTIIKLILDGLGAAGVM
ncbi:hypothetical protein AB0E59_38965 [Lentzea sp. NPDC034063]|uniref:AbiTii domain-containing protein n=1 Tax=unclassified Lentzea TaxID=2643253 RepID=UPI0033CD882D